MALYNNIQVFGKEIIDEKTISQLENCLLEDSIGVLTPDAHYGYAHPIGGAIAYKNHISLSGVGFDIGCGNKAVKTNIMAADVDVPKVMDEIFKRISFGMGRPNNEKVDHPVLEIISRSPFEPQQKLFSLAKDQLGTVGGGNHFVDLFKDEAGYLWIGVHFGSRGFGHKTATGFIAMSQGLSFTDKGKEGSMDSKPILFHVGSEIGKDYITAMHVAGEYAYAGRDIVVDKVLEILGAQSTFEVHNHHNFTWVESHNEETYWVVRKGCTPAFPGQYGFIGANMRDCSVIIQGKESKASKSALYSTVHGAGRIMSRTQAAGKKKWIRGEDGKKRPQVVAPGLVNFTTVKEDLKKFNIELRGAGADEAPECYKKLEQVLGYMIDNVEIKHYLLPIGVAMAGDSIEDPYKD